MGCLYLEIEGQLCLVDNVDRGLMEIGQIGPHDQKRARNNICKRFFPIATVLDIFPANNSKNKCGKGLVKLSAFH